MTPAVSVLVPAFRAQAHIARAVASVLAQTMPAWELIIIADDGQDYAPVLHAQGITDPRIRFASSGAVRSGCARPRNVGLSLARAPIIAMLDADDLFYPEKLARMVPLAARHGLCSCALDYVSDAGAPIGAFGTQAQGPLGPHEYLRTNFSANVMLVFDRTRLPIRWREDVPVLEDLIFAMTAFDYLPDVWHIAQPLHAYVMTPGSLSTGPEAPALFLATKQHMLERRSFGGLGIHNPQSAQALAAFLHHSMQAEAEYAAAQARGDTITFSQLLARRLGAAI